MLSRVSVAWNQTRFRAILTDRGMRGSKTRFSRKGRDQESFAGARETLLTDAPSGDLHRTVEVNLRRQARET
ncbi:hypothetical protein Mam01_64670 [Microbispora amethystogenes]|uniref:Transposase n=1 Tax=Microbispora amethystogenes TaxID=1427754 RepID=A0ABQ4FNH0_9ACTN|nr:hypothetical protein Mam01_64670 [Microbispora amethystogenes]